MFYRSAGIELLLGAEAYSTILLNGVKRGLSHDPVAQETRLGWIITGNAQCKPNSGSRLQYSMWCSMSPDESMLNEALQRFWELKELPESKVESPENQLCERLFVEGHQCLSDGRYIVRLPRRIDITSEILGDTLRTALHSLNGTSKNLNPTCYIPHHGIWQRADQGCKLRVVFDASRRSGRKSLNELLWPGPSLQTDLVLILLRWRRHQFVICADIKMMYRQILVAEDDQDLQRVVWRDPQDTITRHYRLQTITYGMCCAPYLALRTLRQLASDEGHHYPRAAHALLKDTYVDDILTGGPTIEATRSLRDQLISLLKAGGFPLKKIAANDPSLLEDINQADRLRPAWVDFELGSPVQALGVSWDPTFDEFRFKAPDFSLAVSFTKRQVLAAIARLFDPNGWISPVIIVAKCLMQEIWKNKLGWDDPLSPNLAARWHKFARDIARVVDIRIPRWLGSSPGDPIVIHGYADASQLAYAAAVYIASPHRHPSLLLSKVKVAPLKTISVPRLELCAALLLARLLHRVFNEFRDSEPRVYAWTDSKVVLAWLRSDLSRWNVFVANRVAEIEREAPFAIWRHVPSAENPADIASRGSSPVQLANTNLWWVGPDWIAGSESTWPTSSLAAIELPGEELRHRRRPASIDDVSCHVTAIQPGQENLIEHFSSLFRLERVISRCLRVLWLRKSQSKRSLREPITPSELQAAYLCCVRLSQRSAFEKDIEALTMGRELARVVHYAAWLRSSILTAR